MPLLGAAAMLLAFDVDAQVIDDHDRWHTWEHLPERLSIPGFLRGTRWSVTQGAPRYMVLYEVASLDTLTSEAYLARLNNPTPWTTRLMPHYANMTRGLCTVVGSFGYGLGSDAALIRFEPHAEHATDLRRWLLEALRAVPGTTGLGSAHLLEGARAAAMTNEQRIRGRDRGVDGAVIVSGYDGSAVASFAEGLLGNGGLPDRGAARSSYATYRWSYSLASAEVDGPQRT